MWGVLVVLVRLPVTIVLVVLATVIGSPYILVHGVIFWILSYLAAPFVLVAALMRNDKADFRDYISELNTDLRDAPKEIKKMYSAIFEWGFPSA